ncbi:MAG: inorganic diphosphatase, partial [Candidatus Micrarchaeaceae archaeon]
MAERAYEILIEMPKGESRRIHLAYSRAFYIDLGPIKNIIPVNEGKMPIAYGFVVGTLIRDEEEESELDAIVYSKKDYKIGDRIRAYPIAALHIKNGDHKIVCVDDSTREKSWNDIPRDERVLILKYFGYKSPVESVGGKEDALALIEKNLTNRPLPIPKETIIRKK